MLVSQRDAGRLKSSYDEKRHISRPFDGIYKHQEAAISVQKVVEFCLPKPQHHNFRTVTLLIHLDVLFVCTVFCSGYLSRCMYIIVYSPNLFPLHVVRFSYINTPTFPTSVEHKSLNGWTHILLLQ